MRKVLLVFWFVTLAGVQAGPIEFDQTFNKGYVQCYPSIGSVIAVLETWVIQTGATLCHKVRATSQIQASGIGSVAQTGQISAPFSSALFSFSFDNLPAGNYVFLGNHSGEEVYTCGYCPGVCIVPPILSSRSMGACTIPSVPTSGGGGSDENECDGADELPSWLRDELNDCDSGSPIVLDLGRNGFLFGGKDTSIHYDLYADGMPIWINWLTPGSDGAFLVADHNGNGVVDDGSELFGHGTRILLENGAMAPNGFIGLAQYDQLALGGNEDFYISEQDAIWSKLLLWQDHNADGISTADELLSLQDYGITGLETIPRLLYQVDANGNHLPLWGTVYTDQQPMDMVDVFFKKHRLSLTATQN